MNRKYTTHMLIHLSRRRNFCNYPRVNDDAFPEFWRKMDGCLCKVVSPCSMTHVHKMVQLLCERWHNCICGSYCHLLRKVLTSTHGLIVSYSNALPLGHQQFGLIVTTSNRLFYSPLHSVRAWGPNGHLCNE
jgi:hypothetical protein